MLHVVAIVGLALAVLGGLGAYQYQRAEAADAKRASAEEKAATAQAQNAALIAANAALDRTLVEQAKRRNLLNEANNRLKDELSSLKGSFPKEDQSCLDRDLPPALALRLSDRIGASGKAADTGSPASPL